jgi:hypothetical protein
LVLIRNRDSRAHVEIEQGEMEQGAEVPVAA